VKRFLVVRFVQVVITLFILSTLVFGLVRLGSDPVLAFLPPEATEEEYVLAKRRFGLDKPVHIQYVRFLSSAVKGDFGTSIFTRRPVIESFKDALPNSLRLIFVATCIALAAAIPLGVMAAVKKGKTIDTLARVIAGLSQSAPAFWTALMMLQIFSVKLQILPTFGIESWKHYIMPTTCLAFFIVAGPIRLLRSSMLEALDSEYIKLARIKGASPRRVVWKHALRNSLLPVLTFTAMYLAALITGCILIETVFAWPGMGRLAYRAIVNQDYPLIQGVVLTTGTAVIIANFVVDLLYGYIDPRIRR
jgi:peptide/nickel transport system permease protein